MANPEHVEIVEQGAVAIHKWLAENPDVKLDMALLVKSMCPLSSVILPSKDGCLRVVRAIVAPGEQT